MSLQPGQQGTPHPQSCQGELDRETQHDFRRKSSPSIATTRGGRQLHEDGVGDCTSFFNVVTQTSIIPTDVDPVLATNNPELWHLMKRLGELIRCDTFGNKTEGAGISWTRGADELSAGSAGNTLGISEASTAGSVEALLPAGASSDESAGPLSAGRAGTLPAGGFEAMPRGPIRHTRR